MNLKHVFLPLGALAALLLGGCQEEKDAFLGAPDAVFSDQELKFDQAGGRHNVTIYSTRDWTATKDQEWLGISRTRGSHTDHDLTLIADENTGYDRSAVVSVVVGRNLMTRTIKVVQEGPDGPAPVEGVFLTCDFSGSLPADWTIDNKTKPAALSAVWSYSSQYKCMVGTGYVSSSKTNYATESWFISPEVDLTGVKAAFVSMMHSGYRVSKNSGQTFWARPAGGTWKEYAIPNYPDSYTFISSGDIDISELAGQKAQVALKYTSTSSAASTWEVQNLSFSTKGSSGGGGGTTPTPGPDGGTVVYFNNFDKSTATQNGTSWPSATSAEVTGNATGTGAAVATLAADDKVTARGNSNSKTYDGASGANNIFFGAAGANFTIQGITLGTARNYTLSFGGYHSLYGADGDANNFDLTKFTVSLSGDGATWKDLSYTRSDVTGATWDLCTATFTIPDGVGLLYIRFTAKEASSYRLDDVKLTESSTAGTVIDITGGGGVTPPPGPTADTIFEEPFIAHGQGDFTLDEKVLPADVEHVWTYDERYGMKATAYANGVNAASDAWLISPAIDLTDYSAATLTFEQAVNFFTDIATAKNEAAVKISKDNGATWTQLTVPSFPESLSWTFAASGDIDLTTWCGGPVKIAFQYTSTATKAGTWEVKNVKVTGTKEGSSQTTPVTATVSFPQPTVSVAVGQTVSNIATTNSTAAITYASSNQRVATVLNGVITGVAAGTATITASVAAVEGAFTAGSATCTVTVTDGSTPPAPAGDVVFFEESFETGLGEFTLDDKTLGDGLSYVWKHDADNKYAKGSGFAGSSKESESWLISPVIDLTGATEATLGFSQCINKYFGDVSKEAVLQIATVDAAGAPTWAPVTITYPPLPASGNWSGKDDAATTVSLASYVGKRIQLAFVYKSSTTAAGTWEIWNVKVSGKGTGSSGGQGGDQPGGDQPGGDQPGGDQPGGQGGTVLWSENWTGAANETTLSTYAKTGTTVYGGGSVTYTVANGDPKIMVDNQMDDAESQPNLLFYKKASADAAPTQWTIAGIPTGGAASGKLIFKVNNKGSNSKYVVSSPSAGVTVGAVSVGSEAAKPFTITYPISFGTGNSTITLVFENTVTQNVRIDDITLVTD